MTNRGVKILTTTIVLAGALLVVLGVVLPRLSQPDMLSAPVRELSQRRYPQTDIGDTYNDDTAPANTNSGPVKGSAGFNAFGEIFSIGIAFTDILFSLIAANAVRPKLIGSLMIVASASVIGLAGMAALSSGGTFDSASQLGIYVVLIGGAILLTAGLITIFRARLTVAGPKRFSVVPQGPIAPPPPSSGEISRKIFRIHPQPETPRQEVPRSAPGQNPTKPRFRIHSTSTECPKCKNQNQVIQTDSGGWQCKACGEQWQ